MHADDQGRILYRGDVRKYRGSRLPHWEVDDGIYFVTFRLHDSLPPKDRRHISEAYTRLSRQFVDDPSQSPEDYADFALSFFLNRVDSVLDDSCGHCHLHIDRMADTVDNSLRYRDEHQYDLLAWSVMPNHVHVVFQKCPDVSLGEIVRNWKSYTAHRARDIVTFGKHFWQPDYYDRLVRTVDELRDTVRYVWSNPERAGLEDWEWRGLCWPH